MVGADRRAKHSLIEAAVARLPPPAEATITIGASVPPGSGLGTSAAVVVALLAALAMSRGEVYGPGELAAMAHGVEIDLGLQSGVQDQWAAAFGGVGDLAVDYPDVRRREVALEPEVAGELASRLLTVYLGLPHESSQLHESVITGLATSDPHPVFERMRHAAGEAVGALVLGDLRAYGGALTDHHEAIRSLHPALIGGRADAVAAVARGCGALGWKVNGAGGDGGSMTILGPDRDIARVALRQAVVSLVDCRILDVDLAPVGVTATVIAEAE